MTTLEIINNEINKEIENKQVQTALLATTFKGLDLMTMKKAMMEGMMRGFKFKDFLEKNVYAIPFSGGYSLITSIDYSRKIAMRSGLVGKSAPLYTYDKDGKLESCTITIKRMVDGHVGEYTATADFKEYTTGRNLWNTKPKTMLAKVAEMHALRSAFPEEMSQQYTEEEMQKENAIEVKPEITDEIRKEVEDCTTEEKLKAVWNKHKGLGKEFSQLVVAHKKFIQSVQKDEKNS